MKTASRGAWRQLYSDGLAGWQEKGKISSKPGGNGKQDAISQLKPVLGGERERPRWSKAVIVSGLKGVLVEKKFSGSLGRRLAACG